MSVSVGDGGGSAAVAVVSPFSTALPCRRQTDLKSDLDSFSFRLIPDTVQILSLRF